MRNYVIINGVNSLSIKGLAISKLPSISKPPLRVMTEEIDGRDGDIITELGYGSYDKELVIGLYENYDINEIIGFFNQEGTIVFSNEDDKYYNFKIINQIDYEALIKFRTANVTLHCQPFKYPLEEEPIELIDTYIEEEGEEITLTPTEDAPMEITLKGNTSQVVIPAEEGLEAEGTSITLTDVIPTKENYIILKGNTSQNGTPTPDNPVNVNVVSGDNEIVVCGKNLIPFPYQGSTRTDGSLSWVVNDDGTILVNGTNDTGSTKYFNLQYNNGIQLKAGTYTISVGSTSNIRATVAKWGDNTNVIALLSPNTSDTTFTLTEDMIVTIVLAINNGLSVNNILVKPMLEKNTSSTTYEPYTRNTYHINLGTIELCKIGTYQDKLIKSNDKWYWYREIGKVVLNGSENWGNFHIESSGLGRAIVESTNVYFDSDTPSILASNMKGVKYSSSWNNTYDCIASYNNNRFIAYLKNATDLTSFKAILSNSNSIVKYVLSTPTYTEITDTNLINQLNALYNATIYETTNISSIPNDLEPFIDIKYNVVTPSPSPQRPSAINVVSGTNTIKIANEDDTESQTFNIRLGSLKLYKLNDTQDYIYKSADKWYIRNHAKEKTFTGADIEGWGCLQNGRGEWCILTTNIRNEVKQGSSLIADILPFFSSAIFDGLYNQNAITLGGKNIELMIEGINDNDDELFTDFLAIHNLTILYELATPIDTEITDTDLIEDLEALLEATSYNPETNITQTSNDKPFIIYAKALEGGSGEAEVINEGNIYAKPIFEIEGNGIVQVLIDNNEVLQVDTTNDTIIIDTENMEAINKSDNTLANRQVIGDYSKIKLVSGESNVKLTGNYTKGTITKYTRYL